MWELLVSWTGQTTNVPERKSWVLKREKYIYKWKRIPLISAKNFYDVYLSVFHKIWINIQCGYQPIFSWIHMRFSIQESGPK